METKSPQSQGASLSTSFLQLQQTLSMSESAISDGRPSKEKKTYLETLTASCPASSAQSTSSLSAEEAKMLSARQTALENPIVNGSLTYSAVTQVPQIGSSSSVAMLATEASSAGVDMRKCFLCGSSAHMKRYCPLNRNAGSKATNMVWKAKSEESVKREAEKDAQIENLKAKIAIKDAKVDKKFVDVNRNWDLEFDNLVECKYSMWLNLMGWSAKVYNWLEETMPVSKELLFVPDIFLRPKPPKEEPESLAEMLEVKTTDTMSSIVPNGFGTMIYDRPDVLKLHHSWKASVRMAAPIVDERPTKFTGLDMDYKDPEYWEMIHEWDIDYDYTRSKPWLSKFKDAGIKMVKRLGERVVISKVLFNELMSNFYTNDWCEAVYLQAVAYAQNQSSINLTSGRPESRLDTVRYFADVVQAMMQKQGLLSIMIGNEIVRDSNFRNLSSITEVRGTSVSGCVAIDGAMLKMC